MSRAAAPTADAAHDRASDAAPGRVEGRGRTRLLSALWVVLVVAAAAALVCAMVPVGPSWLGEAGAVVVAATYAWALAARAGGRPVVFGVLAVLVGVAVVLTDQDVLHTGAAAMTSVVAAVLAVVSTVPAVTFVRAVRECVVAGLVAAVGALATVGFEPAVDVARFEYATFGIALVLAFVVLYRLGAGLHGLGRRGVAIVVVGGVLLVVTLAYAELLRRYGTPGLVASLLDDVRWSRHRLGAFPRPIETVLGVPALAYGCHMRARRRQGWWVCAFGVAMTSSIASALVNPAISLREDALSVVYGLGVGLGIGFVVIRLDILVTASLSGSRGRRSRVSERAAATRPEPGRAAALR